MRKSTGLLLGAAAVVAAIAAGWMFWPSASTGRAEANDARQVALGAIVYRDHCASCHGANLEGQPNWMSRKPDGRFPAPPHDETGHTWHHPDETLFDLTKLGLKPPLAPAGYQSDMPAFGPVLTDEQIWAVLAFIKSRWPEKIRARHSSLNERASR
jgi:mono/diheme cytochrome c family protein